MDPDPLREAASLALLRDLARLPAAATSFARANAPPEKMIHSALLEKGSFDLLKRAFEAVRGRPVPQTEALRWLLAFAIRNYAPLLEEVRRGREEESGGASSASP